MTRNNRGETFIFLPAWFEDPELKCTVQDKKEEREKKEKALQDINHLMKQFKEIKCENAACISRYPD